MPSEKPDIVPEIEQVFGKQTNYEEMDGHDMQARFADARDWWLTVKSLGGAWHYAITPNDGETGLAEEGIGTLFGQDGYPHPYQAWDAGMGIITSVTGGKGRPVPFPKPGERAFVGTGTPLTPDQTATLLATTLKNAHAVATVRFAGVEAEEPCDTYLVTALRLPFIEGDPSSWIGLAVPGTTAYAGRPIFLVDPVVFDNQWAAYASITDYCKEQSPTCTIAALRRYEGELPQAEGKPVYRHKPLPVEWRSDAPLRRHLERYFGKQCARAWTKADLVYLGEVREEIVRRGEELSALVPDLTYRPWSDVILDFGVIPAEKMEGFHEEMVDGDLRPLEQRDVRFWARVCDGETYLHTRNLRSPWMKAKDALSTERISELGRDLSQILFVECFIQLAGAEDVAEPYIISAWVYDWARNIAVLKPKNLRDELHESYKHSASWLGSIALAGMAYLAQMPEWLVERRLPLEGKARKRHEKQDQKYWTMAGLPSILLIDPQHAPRPKGASLGGTHASPRHHKRRATRVHLRNHRFYDPMRYNDYRPGASPTAEVPPLVEVFECWPSAGAPAFVFGADADKRQRAYRKEGRLWRELLVRVVDRKESWAGPLNYIGGDGHAYRVLVKESTMQEGEAE